jgi:hypothetical protein
MNQSFVHIRAVDAIRYPIVCENSKYFFIYNNSRVYINLNLDLTKSNIIILDQSTNYVDFKTNAEKGFPIITVNGIQIENKKLPKRAISLAEKLINLII